MKHHDQNSNHNGIYTVIHILCIIVVLCLFPMYQLVMSWLLLALNLPHATLLICMSCLVVHRAMRKSVSSGQWTVRSKNLAAMKKSPESHWMNTSSIAAMCQYLAVIVMQKWQEFSERCELNRICIVQLTTRQWP